MHCKFNIAHYYNTLLYVSHRRSYTHCHPDHLLSIDVEVGGETEDSLPALPALKRSWAVTASSSLSSSTPQTSTPGLFFNPRGGGESQGHSCHPDEALWHLD